MELSSPSPFSPLFFLFLRLRREVTDPRFIHGYESTQELDLIPVKRRLKRPHDAVFVPSRRPSCRLLCHVPNFRQCTIHNSTIFFLKILPCPFTVFWRGHFTWTTTAMFQLCHPIFYCCKRRSRFLRTAEYS